MLGWLRLDRLKFGSEELSWPVATAAAIAAAAGSVVLAVVLPFDGLLPLQLASVAFLFTAYVSSEMTAALTEGRRPRAYFPTSPRVPLGVVMSTMAALAIIAANLSEYYPAIVSIGIGPAIERFHKAGVGALFWMLAVNQGIRPELRSAFLLISVSNLAALVLSTLLLAVTLAPALPSPMLVLAVSILVSVLFVCVKVWQICAWARQSPTVDKTLGQPITSSLAVSSCVATSICFSWFVLVSMFGSLLFGISLFVVLYALSTALGFVAVVVLAKFIKSRAPTIATPFQLFDRALEVRGLVRFLAVVGIWVLYVTIGYLELRLVYVAGVAGFGPIAGLLVAVCLLLFVVAYVSAGGFWGSVRTDALQLAHMAALAGLTLATVLLSPSPDAGGGTADFIRRAATAWRAPGLQPWSWLFAINLMIGHAVTICVVPDMWSRFALPLAMNQVKTIGLLSLAILVGLAGVVGTLGAAAIGMSPGLLDSGGINEVALMQSYLLSVQRLNLSADADAWAFCGVVAAACVALLAAMATLDTVVSSAWQGWRTMSAPGLDLRQPSTIAVAAAVGYAALVLLAHFPLVFLAAFLTAASIAATPLWISRFLPMSDRTIRWSENVSAVLMFGWSAVFTMLSVARISNAPLAGAETLVVSYGALSTIGLVGVLVGAHHLVHHPTRAQIVVE